MPILNMGSGGIDTSDATADAGKILYPYTAYKDGEKVTGSIQSLAAQTITPGTADQIIMSGRYLAGAQTIKGDSNLSSGNIVSGKSIFGVLGSAYIFSPAAGYCSSMLISYTASVGSILKLTAKDMTWPGGGYTSRPVLAGSFRLGFEIDNNTAPFLCLCPQLIGAPVSTLIGCSPFTWDTQHIYLSMADSNAYRSGNDYVWEYVIKQVLDSSIPSHSSDIQISPDGIIMGEAG